MEELTREEAIRRHRLMWNWMADESEQKHFNMKENAFKHFGWSISEALSRCWCCEWVFNEWEHSKDFPNNRRFPCCDGCPLDWSNGQNEVVKADCEKIITRDGCTRPGLYKEWYLENCVEKNLDESSKLARIIANLPEKKEVQNND